MLVDLCLWAKNGSRTLPVVLKTAEKVIPDSVIVRKIFVDDSSKDDSREIAQSFGWTVYKNKTGWLCGGVNEAFSHVREDFFVTLEQDVVLCENWFNRLALYMDQSNVAVAQGIRISTLPILSILGIEPAADARRLEAQRTLRVPNYFWSIDNNIIRTQAVNDVGGFDKTEKLAVDWFFLKALERSGRWIWRLDPSVVSWHIRNGVRQHFAHEQRMMYLSRKPLEVDKTPLLRELQITATSPLRGLQFAFRERFAPYAALYPYIRLRHLQSYFIRRKRGMDFGE